MCGSVNDLRSKADVKRAIKTSVASMQVCLVMLGHGSIPPPTVFLDRLFVCLFVCMFVCLFVCLMYSRVKQRDCKYETPKMKQC